MWFLLLLLLLFFLLLPLRRSFSQSIRHYDFETFIIILSYVTFTKTFNL